MNEEIPTRVSAGGVVLRKEGGHWMIAMEQQEKYMDGAWFLPKGHVEEGEGIEAAARREILEEVGIGELELIEYLGKKERMSTLRSEFKIIHYFWFETVQVEMVPVASDKIHRGKWFDLFSEEVTTPYEEQNEIIELVRQKLASSNKAGN